MVLQIISLVVSVVGLIFKTLEWLDKCKKRKLRNKIRRLNGKQNEKAASCVEIEEAALNTTVVYRQ